MTHKYEADHQSGAGNCTCGAPERHPRHPHAYAKAWDWAQGIGEEQCTCMRRKSDPIHENSLLSTESRGRPMSDFVTHMCPACAAGIFEECLNPKVATDPGVESSFWIVPCALEFMYEVGEPGGKGLVGRPPASPSEITDPKSTGRKRAAMLAPILTGQVCGWAGLRHAGGGPIPILGCNGHQIIEQKGGDEDNGLWQGDRHHGPDKNTLNNSVGMNLHSICVDCHHRWHAINDQFYDEAGRPSAEFAFTPVVAYYLHDPLTTFTDDEFNLAEAWWSQDKKIRGEYPFSPPSSTRQIDPASATLESDDDNPFPESSPFTEIGDS